MEHETGRKPQVPSTSGEVIWLNRASRQSEDADPERPLLCVPNDERKETLFCSTAPALKVLACRKDSIARNLRRPSITNGQEEGRLCGLSASVVTSSSNLFIAGTCLNMSFRVLAFAIPMARVLVPCSFCFQRSYAW